MSVDIKKIINKDGIHFISPASMVSNMLIDLVRAQRSFRDHYVPHAENFWGRGVTEKLYITELRIPNKEEMRVSIAALMLMHPMFENSILVSKNGSSIPMFLDPLLRRYEARGNALDFTEHDLEERFWDFYHLKNAFFTNDKQTFEYMLFDVETIFIDLSWCPDEQRTEWKSRMATMLFPKDFDYHTTNLKSIVILA